MLIFTILGFLIKDWKYVLFAGALGVATAWYVDKMHKEYDAGIAAEQATMEKANAAAKSAADKAQAEVDACYDRGTGFTWDRATGVCHGPAASKSSVRRHH